MAPSEIPSTTAGLSSSSRYVSSSSATPSSAPLSPSPAKNTRKEGKETDARVSKDTLMADSPANSDEEIYWSDHSTSDDDHDGGHDDNTPEDYHRQGDSGEMLESEQEQGKSHHHQRRPRIRSSARYSNDKFNGSSIKAVPEVKYAKAGILSPTNTIMDRGGYGDAFGQMQPGETLYLPENPENRASGQYQMHPGYNGNGANVNGNYNNGNTNGGYGSNGESSPQPHPPHHYNGNRPLPQYPLHHYPQVPVGGPPYPITYYDPHAQNAITYNTTSENGLNVRGEEVGIVLVVLLLWVGAIILFFNRWGKIRMLEPYQPKFCENHRPSCPMADVTAISNIPVCRERGFSKYNLSTEMLSGTNGSPHFVKCNYHGIPSADPAPGFSGLTTTSGLPGGLTIPGAGFPGGGSTGMLNNHRNSMMMMNHHLQHHHHHHLRPRQNSVFATSPSSQVNFYGSDTALKSSSRKTKSAVDLPTLVLTGEFMDNVRRNSKNSITQL